ncbi:glycoside hydrolase family 15 protein [Halapricum salinum]|uniref:Glucoamylase n=1 Tax=Halapricum salinum TaxID=1457250 RepID=A0A4D6HC44_9EURY|nr:glycoside hydrolase family 15 protein [Halapricum salinum]QCC51370.1 glucoamylase [Halapricum salinum]
MSEDSSQQLPPSAVVSGGEDTFWTHGDKHGFATLNGHDQTPIWFTLTEGAMTEVRYPRIDMMNNRTVEFVIADPDDGYAVRTYHQYQDQEPRVNRETEQLNEDALLYRQRLSPTDDGRDWELTVEYAIHPDYDAVLLDVDFEADAAYDLYVMSELMLSNCGRHDIANRRPREDGTVALTGYHTGDTWDDHVVVERTEVEVGDEPIGTGDVTSEGRGDEADSPERTPAEEEDDEPIGSGDVTSVGVVDQTESGEDEEPTTTYEEDPYHIAAALTSREGFSWGSVDISGGRVYRSLLEDGDPEHTYERATDKVVIFGRLGEKTESLSDTVALGFAEGEGDETAGEEPTAATADEPGESTATTTPESTDDDADSETSGEADPGEYADPGEDPGEFDALAAAESALEDDFETVQARFARTWESYVETLDIPESVADEDDLRAQYKTAVMTVKAADSKAYPGAGIASPSVPWGDKVQADEPADYGYSYVWARDLYGSFTAFEAMGDVDAAIDATEYIYEYQQRETGFLPQNTFIDGRTRWGGEQMDEIAFPAVMAYQLKERHGYGVEEASYDYENIAKSAEYVAANGPRTQQERWEEEGGYSPSTTAAEISGLVAAADMAVEAGERADAIAFLGIADYWQENVETWMATETGAGGHENTPYYFRISDDARPDEHTMRTHNNAGGTFDEREVIDGGFLELVRLGVKPHDDPVVQNSLVEYDDTIMVETPNGPGWYRYSGDGYGEKDGSEWFRAGVPWATDMRGQGRLWPIFTGERGEYELLRGEDQDFDPNHLLETLARFATGSRAMPEQVWDHADDNAYGWEFGEGTSAATPLCWTNAQYIRLAHSIDAGEPVEMPQVVRDRYVDGVVSERPSLTAEIPDTARGGSLTVTGNTDADEVVVKTRTETVHEPVSESTFEIDVTVQGEDRVIVAAATDDPAFEAGIAVEYVTVTYQRRPATATDETGADASAGDDAVPTATDAESVDEDEEGVSS